MIQKTINPKSDFILGCDLSRMGEDETCLIVVEKPLYGECIYVVYIETYKHKVLTEAIGKIKYLDNKFNFRRIYIDATGLGASVSDILREDFKFKLEDVTFTIKNKMSLYGNLKLLMERGKIKIPPHKKLYYQLLDLRYEVTKSGDLKIHHSPRGHDDLTDALALACYYFKGSSNTYIPTIA